MQKLSTIFLSMTLCMLPMHADAYSDAEIDRMIQALKAENQALRDEIRKLNEKADSRIEEQVISSEPNSKTLSSAKMENVKLAIDEQEDKLQVNGFLSAGFTKSDPEVSNASIALSDEVSFNAESIFGLQISTNLTNNFDVTAQFVARGSDDWNVEAEWAFLRYKFSNQFSARIGRLRLPLYLYSESLEVGFSYPWIRPPVEVYASPITNYEGIDTIYSIQSGDWVHNLQFFTGSNTASNFQTKAFFGGNITSYYDAWTLRLSSYKFNIDFDSFRRFSGITGTINNKGLYSTAAVAYDDGDWLFISEFSKFDVDDPIFFRDTNAGYITVGKRFGKFLPHLTYAKSQTVKEPPPIELFSIDIVVEEATVVPNPAFGPDATTQTTFPTIISQPVTSDILNFTGESYTLGVKYDLSSQVSVKLEWNHYTELDDTGGIWNGLTIGNNAEGVDEIDIYSFIIDAAF